MAADAPIRSPDLVELRALVAAARHGSIGAAARELGVSQPALSKRLRQLEDVVGLRLLERSPRGVTPTDAGHRLLLGAQRVLDQLGDLDRTVLELRGRPRPLRLAASPVVAESLLPSILTAFHRQPGREPVELIVGNSDLVRELVASGRADVGIAGSGPGEDEGHHVLAEDELVVAVPAGHPWQALDAVPLAKLVSTPLVLRDPGANQRQVLDALLASLGLALAPPRVEVGSTTAALAASAETGVPALLSRLSVPPDSDVALRPIDGPRLARRFVVLVSAARAPSAAVERLVAALRP
ncbi:LysR-family transcriptional regulator [Patulibacter medicamentivorans]|uniref:LysR-family transcriptional regulator n=1 Tax=Patulibacter medicamentivorans TaxID=1097667 RepID=H0E9X5_9ACTN|nr:LysR family transcriptional regulator [Patulibacter medicamentivorans]EHN09523.1 LysR-family transcriptional regulator [Patulibacter medicamentivorans]